MSDERMNFRKQIHERRTTFRGAEGKTKLGEIRAARQIPTRLSVLHVVCSEASTAAQTPLLDHAW